MLAFALGSQSSTRLVKASEVLAVGRVKRTPSAALWPFITLIDLSKRPERSNRPGASGT